jgi:platelet-activating factor acetylhydrolase IB subunit alpha
MEEITSSNNHVEAMPTTWLTTKQQQELHEVLLDYLHQHGFQKTYHALLEETHISIHTPTHRHVLERRWTSLIRLQKQVLELEQQLAQFQTLHRTPSLLTTPSATWVIKNPERLSLQGHRQTITHVAFHPHPAYPLLASASEDATIRIYHLETGVYERTLRGHTQAIHDICFDPSPISAYLASCSADLTIKLWAIHEDYTCVKTLHGHEHVINSIAFSASSSSTATKNDLLLLISASRDQTVRVWNVAMGTCIRYYEGHRDWVRSVHVSADGQWVASAGNDQMIHIWHIHTGETRIVLEGHSHVIESVVFAPTEGKSIIMVASASRDKTIRLWSNDGECIAVLHGHDNWVRAIAFHPAGNYLISVSDDRTLRWWDLRTKTCSRTVEQAHNNFITCVAFNMLHTSHPLLIATGSVDQTVKLWECSSEKLL